MSDTRCGYIALVGAPNVGKSTLMNALVGEALSIVTPKAQTTWARVTGIRTDEGVQMVFLDTPGLLEPQTLLHRSLLLGARDALADADVVALVVDPTHPLDPEARARLLETLAETSVPRIGIVNKADIASDQQIAEELEWLTPLATHGVAVLSAKTLKGIDPLLERLEELLPPSPFLFPEDDIASAPVRFFIAEMVREAVFEQYHREVPYATFCRVEEFREEEERTYIQVTAYVERASQKGILIGKGGTAIRALGSSARRRIEHFLGRPVYLDLWVKVLPNWRRRPDQLRRLGLPVPTEDRAT